MSSCHEKSQHRRLWFPLFLSWLMKLYLGPHLSLARFYPFLESTCIPGFPSVSQREGMQPRLSWPHNPMVEQDPDGGSSLLQFQNIVLPPHERPVMGPDMRVAATPDTGLCSQQAARDLKQASIAHSQELSPRCGVQK